MGLWSGAVAMDYSVGRLGSEAAIGRRLDGVRSMVDGPLNPTPLDAAGRRVRGRRQYYSVSHVNEGTCGLFEASA